MSEWCRLYANPGTSNWRALVFSYGNLESAAYRIVSYSKERGEDLRSPLRIFIGTLHANAPLFRLTKERLGSSPILSSWWGSMSPHSKD